MNIFIKEYGFKPEYDKNTGELKELYRIEGYYLGETKKRRKSAIITKDENLRNKKFKAYWIIDVIRRRFFDFTPYGNYYLSLDHDDYEILYDLIQAGLVEKVEG